MFLNNFQFPVYNPPETSGGVLSKPDVKSNSPGSKELSKQDIFEILSKDDDEETIPLEDGKDGKGAKDGKKKSESESEETSESDDSDEKDGEDDSEDEDDDLKAIEDELDEPDEDKLELATPTARREILKKYPKLFKEFPYLEKAYYREQEFTKLLPTIADAKEAVNKSDILDKFERDLSEGNTEVVLAAVKNNDPKAFNKIVDNYLTTLSKVDEKAYHHVLGNTIKHTIMAMVQEARNQSNEQLEQAATILNQFVFGSSKFTAPEKLSREDKSDANTEKEQQISEREKKFTEQKFNTANDELSSRVGKAYKATIESKIDPKQSMTEYVRKTATRDALEELESLIDKDTRFKTLVDKLWEKAATDDFSSESVAKIRSAFISKAQTLLPSVIQKARNEALKGMGKRVSNSSKDDDEDSRPSKNESRNGDGSRPRKESNRGDESHRRNDSGTRKVPKGVSSLEYLMSDD